MKRHGMKTRSRRGRLSVRKTRSRRKTPRKCKQRGGNFIQSTLGIPGDAYVTKDLDPKDGSAPVLISKEEGTAQEVA